MRQFKVDGELWEVLEVKAQHPRPWVALLSRRVGELGGPSRSFSVPCTEGRFVTSGHAFDFSAVACP